MIKTLENDILICNVCEQNKDNPKFCSQLEECVRQLGIDNIVIGGDWNVVLNFQLDCHDYKHNNSTRGQKQIDKMMKNVNLIDIWRELNTEVLRYTWHRKMRLQHSRLDYFLMSDSLSALVVDADITPGYRTDHFLIILSLSNKEEERRFNLRKLNSSHLRDKNYLTQINNVVREVTEEYSAFSFERKNLGNIPLMEVQLVISDQTF